MQDLKGKVKVAAAAMAGSLMLGATMAGAVAADLGQLPAPFVSDNELAGQIVVGANAAVPDVIASAQIAAAFGEYLVTASATGGATTASGYELEDLALNAIVKNGLGKVTYTDTDIDKLIDSEITFRNEDYDVQENIVIGASNPKLATGLDDSIIGDVRNADDYGSDVGAKVYMNLPEGSFGYRYVFDDELNATDSDTEVNSEYPLEISVLGEDLTIVEVYQTSDKIKAQLGSSSILYEGDSMTVEGYTLTVDTIASDDVVVSCGGESKVVSESGEKTFSECGSITVEAESVFFSEAGASSNFVELRAGTETTDTYSDGDPYIGEDDDDPDWVWDISITDGVINYIGVTREEPATSMDENPITMGEEYALPNDYVVLKLHSYNTETRGQFELTFDSSEDIHYSNGTVIPYFDNEPVWVFDGPADDAFSGAGHEAEKILFSQHAVAADQFFYVAYYDEDESEFVNGTQLLNASAAGVDTTWDLQYQDSIYSIYVASDSLGNYNITLKDGTYDEITLTPHSAAIGLDYLGATEDDSEAGEVVVGTETIGTSETDVLTHFGTIIEDPDSKGDSDKVVLQIPVEQVKANVYLGAAGTAISGGDASVSYGPLNAEVAVLDSEADESGTPLVVVGGPYANAFAADLIGDDDTTIRNYFEYDEGTNSGVGVVQLYDAADTPWNAQAMVVAGWDADDTRAAAHAAAQYMTGARTLSDLDGQEKFTVTATSATQYTVEV